VDPEQNLGSYSSPLKPELYLQRWVGLPACQHLHVYYNTMGFFNLEANEVTNEAI
jgi:hypothetical protein